MRRRKQWLRTGRVPRSTLQRWIVRQRETAAACVRPAPGDGDVPGEDGSNFPQHMDVGVAEPGVGLPSEPEDDGQAPGLGGGSPPSSHGHSSSSSDSDSSTSDNSDSDSSLSSDDSDSSDGGSHFNSDDTSGASLNSDGEDVDEHFQFMPDPLFQNSKQSAGQAINELLRLYRKHALSKSCLRDLIKLIYKLLPPGNLFPRSFYFLQKFIKPFVPPKLSVLHEVCASCGMYVGRVSRRATACRACPSMERISFQEFSLEIQLRYLFEKRGLADAMDRNLERPGSDITRSEEYRAIRRHLTGRYDAVLQWGTDGFNPHICGLGELWSLACSVCEVAPQLRPFYTVVAAVWYSKVKRKPDMNSFLVPFVNSLVKLLRNGVSWTHPKTGEKIVSKVVAPQFSADAPARAMLMNMLQYNGTTSCNICEISGITLRLGQRSQKIIFPFPEEQPLLRTAESMQQYADEALASNLTVKGVKGKSILEAIPHCDISKGVVLDYMHLVLLGVTRQFFVAWFTKSRTDFYIGRHKKIVTAFLKAIRRLYEVTRCPAGVHQWKTFKASTWRTWLLFVSLPALKGVSKDKYFQHWMLFVHAIALLLKSSVSEADKELAGLLLKLFVKDTEELYGDAFMTYNLHGVLHLALMVTRWGGLWATSTFRFESLNGILARLLHGTRRLSAELGNSLSLVVAGNTLDFFMKQQNDHQASISKLLSPRDFEVSAEVRPVFQAIFHETVRLRFYARAAVKGTIYTSELYYAEKATDNTNISFMHEGTKMYGAVRCYFKDNLNCFALIRLYQVQNDQFFRNNETGIVITHLIPIENTQDHVIVSLTAIVEKMFKVHNYLCEELNHYERKL